MVTVQMTIDEDLVREVDKVSKQLQTNRSAFTRKALRMALDHLKIEQLEQQHRQGYKKTPPAADEFSVWETEQDWGD